MREALRLAKKAAASDEVPIGAVIAKNGRIVGRGYNQVEMLKDPTAHAEILAITQAAAAVGDWRLNDCGGVLNLLQMSQLNHRCDIASGVLAQECSALLQEFFRSKRDTIEK